MTGVAELALVTVFNHALDSGLADPETFLVNWIDHVGQLAADEERR